MANEVKNQRTLTVNQQTIEDWINQHEDMGRFLNEMGIVSDEEMAAGVTRDEKIRLKIEANPSLANEVVADVEAGNIEGAEAALDR